MKRRTMVFILLGGGLLLGTLAGLLSSLLPFANTAFAQASGNKQAAERVMIMAVEQNINGERYAGEVRVTFEDPAELPADAPGVDGLYLGREGSVLTVGGGAIEVELDVEVVNDEEPTTTVHAGHSGGEFSVVVTDDTVFYEDTTSRPEITPEDIEAGQLLVTRTVAPGSLDGIGENTLIRAWGTEQNGQFVADLIVYEPIR